MRVTDVRLEFPAKRGSTKAYATVEFDSEFAVDGFRVADYGSGPTMYFPARKVGDKFLPICRANKALEDHIRREVVKKYGEAMADWVRREYRMARDGVEKEGLSE